MLLMLTPSPAFRPVAPQTQRMGCFPESHEGLPPLARAVALSGRTVDILQIRLVMKKQLSNLMVGSSQCEELERRVRAMGRLGNPVQPGRVWESHSQRPLQIPVDRIWKGRDTDRKCPSQ